MAKRPEPDWYLQEWATLYGKSQNSLVTELGYLKNTAHRLWKGKQPYRRDYVNQISIWLNVQPWELLMHPDQAMAIRRLRSTAAEIVRDNPLEVIAGVRSTGTDG